MSRTPVITIAAAESDPQYVYEDADGKQFDHYDLTFPREAFEAIRQGYACLRCWERQETPYPKNETHLPGCPYAPDGMKHKQAADIAVEFYGEKWVGPKQKLEDTIAEDDEKRRKYRIDTGKKAGIIVPPWVKL